MDVIKKLFLYSLLIGLSNLVSAQKDVKSDIWSGIYVVCSVNKESSEIVDTLIINRTKDADPKKVAARYESDLDRWTIFSKKDGDKEKAVIKRFLFDIKNKEDGYKEFGWTDLHEKGKMNCIDGGHFFICQTEPDTKVSFSKDETYLTKTGIFGIWLDYGIAELEKIEN